MLRLGALAGTLALMLLSEACTSGDIPAGRPDGGAATGPAPGSARDFSWEWNRVARLPGDGHVYSIAVRFANTSSRSARVPDCWAVPGPGRAASLAWSQVPVVDPGGKVVLYGTVRFKRPIPEIDEVVCDSELAESYRSG